MLFYILIFVVTTEWFFGRGVPGSAWYGWGVQAQMTESVPKCPEGISKTPWINGGSYPEESVAHIRIASRVDKFVLELIANIGVAIEFRP